MKLKNSFESRAEFVSYLHQIFPEATVRSPELPDKSGGRKAAEQILETVNPETYAATRNSLEGAVTRLSPYIRHGVISIGEIRYFALESGRNPVKLINELGWRDYFQRVYRQVGDGIWSDRENWKTGFKANDYAADLPDDIPTATTSLACMDGISRELHQTGYLHNHQRLWMAAYVVHFRRVKWQLGARWFLQHLLDGDPASNNLSWQWVASTFSSKPYYFNRENLEKFTEGKYCRVCPLNKAGCPFEASYERLEANLFPNKPVEDDRDQRGKNQKGSYRQ